MNDFLLWVMVFAFIAGILMLVSFKDRNAHPVQTDFNVVCLDGVEYWYRQSGYKSAMALRYTAEGTVITCGRSDD